MIPKINPILSRRTTTIWFRGCYVYCACKVYPLHTLSDRDINWRKWGGLGLRGMHLRDRSCDGGGSTPACSVDITPVTKQLIGGLHRHATEVGNEVCTVGMTCDLTFGAPASILAAKRKDVTTMATPIRA